MNFMFIYQSIAWSTPDCLDLQNIIIDYLYIVFKNNKIINIIHYNYYNLLSSEFCAMATYTGSTIHNYKFGH